MLSLGMKIHGSHEVRHIIGQTRRGAPDGAVILVQRRMPGNKGLLEFVVGRVAQWQIEAPEPVAHWANGDYFDESNAVRDGVPHAVRALHRLLQRSGLEARTLADMVEDPAVKASKVLSEKLVNEFPDAEPDALTLMVADVAARAAADVNKGGVASQIAYLAEAGVDGDEIRETLRGE